MELVPNLFGNHDLKLRRNCCGGHRSLRTYDFMIDHHIVVRLEGQADMLDELCTLNDELWWAKSCQEHFALSNPQGGGSACKNVFLVCPVYLVG